MDGRPGTTDEPRGGGTADGRRPARLLLGALALAAEVARDGGARAGGGPRPSTAPVPMGAPTLPAVMAGVLVEASAAATGLIGRGTRIAGRAAAVSLRGAGRIAPRAATDRVATLLRGYAAIGRASVYAGRAEIAASVPGLADRLVDPVVDHVLDRAVPDVLTRLESGGDRPQLVELVESVVDDVLPPVVERALPEALGRLGADPEPVRDLVWGQGAGMANEVAGRVQEAARQADERVDRLARRLGLRR